MMDKLVHRCSILDGPMEGNTHRETVEPFHIECATECLNCGKLLGPIEEVVAALYEEATS